MSLVGVINSDETINTLIVDELKLRTHRQYKLRIPEGENNILQFLNFDLPEIVVVNLSDKDIRIDYIFEQVRSDSWLHNFGIIGLFDSKKDSEKALIEKYKDINILTFIDFKRIKYLLIDHIRIIDQNRQIIFQMEMVDKLVEQVTGSFIIDNDPYAGPVYAGLLSTLLVHWQYIDSEVKINLQLALTELIQNAIEHGNCKITAEEKGKVLEKGGNILDLISEKNKEFGLKNDSKDEESH